MKIGYARTSTVEQIAGLEAQERELREAGVEKVFSERVSSVGKREQLEAALEFCRKGDVLVVTKLDRLARSMTDLVGITARLKAKGVELQVLAMALDTSTSTGKLMLNLMGSFAEFEREIMLERQREGVAKAKAEGKYKGRVPTAQRKATEVILLRGQGVKPKEIAAKLGISRASVFRVLKERRNSAPLLARVAEDDGEDSKSGGSGIKPPRVGPPGGPLRASGSHRRLRLRYFPSEEPMESSAAMAPSTCRTRTAVGCPQGKNQGHSRDEVDA